MFDWNRLDKDGKPRELKIEEGIRSLRSSTVPVTTQQPRKTEYPQCERLVIDENFILNRWRFSEPAVWYNNDRCHLMTVLEGTADIIFTAGRRVTNNAARETDPEAIETLQRGDSILVPAVCRELRWIPQNRQHVVWLDAAVEKSPSR
jgi:hypothetical protein